MDLTGAFVVLPLSVNNKFSFVRWYVYDQPFLLWSLHPAVPSAPSVREALDPPVEQKSGDLCQLHHSHSLLGHSQICIVLSEERMKDEHVGSC